MGLGKLSPFLVRGPKVRSEAQMNKGELKAALITQDRFIGDLTVRRNYHLAAGAFHTNEAIRVSMLLATELRARNHVNTELRKLEARKSGDT